MSEQYHPAGAATVYWNQYRRKHELYLVLDEEENGRTYENCFYIRDVEGREPMPVEVL